MEVFMKRIISILLAVLAVMMPVSLVSSTASATPSVTVYVDGTLLEADVPARIIDSRTMVPLRAIFEAIGAKVIWDDTTKTAISEKDGTTVKVAIGQYSINKNGTDIPIDVPAQIIDSRTLVPARAIAESYDCKVFWDNDTKTVRIKSFELSEPVLSELDKQIVVRVGTKEISKATYSLYEAVIANSDTDISTDELLRQHEAICLFAQKNNITVTAPELDKIDVIIDSIIKSGSYEQQLAAYKTSDKAYRDYIVSSVLLQKAVLYTPEEVDDNKALEYAKQNYVRVKHTVVKTAEEAAKVLERISNGEAFEAVVSDTSFDSMNVKTGYVFTKGEMVKEFEDASFALAEGQVSGVIPSSYGYHVIKRYPLVTTTEEALLAECGERFKSALIVSLINTEINSIYDSLTIEKL